ncbi:MAG: RagB/SusD family nutrient uptake outer membrane protein [Prevotellaceae bacterium]|nr:RagB/SusD family nutrient uptake outer membrane protein [Prevotellaceae bacterium]
MKKWFNLSINNCQLSIATLAFAMLLGSCSDMLETSSSRQVFDPELNTKTDSVFYAFGVMQAMQQLADQYFFIGEMRGDMVSTTKQYTDNNLRQLADFSATGTNKYDSAYVYYKVINNCNYYLEHRDTTLTTGAVNVVINEYAAIAAFRAWAYLQLGRLYERVPYYTESLTSISQIDDNNFPEYTLEQIVEAETANLKPFAGLSVPTFSTSSINIGTTNWGQSKTLNPALCFIPVDVIMGELYLEVGKYKEAAESYFRYLRNAQSISTTTNKIVAQARGRHWWSEMPSDYDNQKNQTEFGGGNQWSSIFVSSASPLDVVTYIPMAVNYTRGCTTDIPLAFGYDYYSTDRSGSCPQVRELQIQPSDSYYAITDSAGFYYYSLKDQTSVQRTPVCAPIGDGRANILSTGEGEDSTLVWVPKVRNANIILYRNSTIYLHLAEALNRMGYPDAAFCILKDGLSQKVIDYVADGTGDSTRYITPETYNMLRTTIPFLSSENVSRFPADEMQGIHGHGCGAVGGLLSPYQMVIEVGNKMTRLAAQFPDMNITNCKADTINAIEDLLCDEYAMEFAFEGSRFYDLCRIARHKNQDSTYGANYGSKWLASKLDYKQPKVSLLEPKNWFLPFN